MKKLFLVLLVVALASFLFVGCIPSTPAEGEGEGEGETEVVVTIGDSVVVDGKTYVSCGNHSITVTFPTPVVGYVEAYISCCTGDYSKVNNAVAEVDCDTEVVLFPDADKKVWTGSGYFGCMITNGIDEQRPPIEMCSPCCASYVEIYAGECEDEACIWFPVVVDCCPPYAQIDIAVEDCTCEDCKLVFTTGETEGGECAPDTECCGDSCSGLANWSVVLYDGDPFDECCDPSICEEPIGSCSGTACPIECETECLKGGAGTTYYAVITLVDNVGLETVYYTQIVLSGDGSTEDCAIEVHEGFENLSWVYGDPCIDWEQETTDYVGTCEEACGVQIL